MARHVEGPRELGQDPPRSGGGGLWLPDLRQDDRELVASQACDRELCIVVDGSRNPVSHAHRLRQPYGHLLEEQVADRVSKRIVDALEVVEVEVEKRKGLEVSSGSGNRVDQEFAQQSPVGERRLQIHLYNF